MAEEKKSAENSNHKLPGRPFEKGISANPGGRPKLSDEIKEIKKSALAKAIVLLADKINDPDFPNVDNKDFARIIEIVFDRFGLPKVTTNQITGTSGGPLVVQWGNNDSSVDPVLSQISTDCDPSTD